MCFRPHIGEYFFIKFSLIFYRILLLIHVSVPILGSIFLSIYYREYLLVAVYLRFRPHIGEYFFIEIVPTNVFTRKEFPSPYWGVFFYPYPL